MSTDDPPKSKQSQRQVLQSLYDVSWCCERFYHQMTLKSLEFRIRNTPLCLFFFFFLVSKEMIRVSQLRLRKLRKRVKKKKKKKKKVSKDSNPGLQNTANWATEPHFEKWNIYWPSNHIFICMSSAGQSVAHSILLRSDSVDLHRCASRAICGSSKLELFQASFSAISS